MIKPAEIWAEEVDEAIDNLSAPASGQPLYGLEEKIAGLMQRNKVLREEVERLRAFIDDLPRITAGMKLDCMGQFSWREEAPYYDKNGNVIEHTATHTVPWDVCKDIYKSMVQAKLRQQAKEQNHEHHRTTHTRPAARTL